MCLSFLFVAISNWENGLLEKKNSSPRATHEKYGRENISICNFSLGKKGKMSRKTFLVKSLAFDAQGMFFGGLTNQLCQAKRVKKHLVLKPEFPSSRFTKKPFNCTVEEYEIFRSFLNSC